jgi:uncharacterized protein YdhG (YjbR/CyaY superfamily)
MEMKKKIRTAVVRGGVKSAYPELASEIALKRVMMHFRPGRTFGNLLSFLCFELRIRKIEGY